MFGKISTTVATLSLSAALIGCREKRPAPENSQSSGAPESTVMFSLHDAQRGAEGGRVYLTNITLKPIVLPTNLVNEARYEVIDTRGQRMVGILNAPVDSFLWRLVPLGEARRYSDFGAIIQTIDGSSALSIFKLAN